MHGGLFISSFYLPTRFDSFERARSLSGPVRGPGARRQVMKYVPKLSHFDAALVLPEDPVTRLGSLGVIGGGLLALVALMF